MRGPLTILSHSGNARANLYVRFYLASNLASRLSYEHGITTEVALLCLMANEVENSIKSNEHARRMSSHSSSRDVNIIEDNETPYSKELFLSNTHNKTQLISNLSNYLREDDQIVYTCTGDADTEIVFTALDLAKISPVCVVVDDTDVAVMLLYHWREEMSEIYFLQERGKKSWKISENQQDFIDKESLLFVHA